MESFNSKINYNMRMYNSIIYAIKEFLDFPQLQKCEQDDWEKDFDKIPLGNDEAAKQYRDNKFSVEEVLKIKTITKRILKEKEKRDDGQTKEEEKDVKQRIKESAAKSFARDYIDFAEEFYEVQPFFFDDICNWWLWSEKESFWGIIDETTLLNEIYDSCKVNGIKLTSTGVKGEIKTAMQMVGRRHKPKEAYNRWIQFKDKAFSLRSGKLHKVTSDFLFTNPIPYDLGETNETPVMDKLFKEWVGEKYIQTLYEIIAYACYTEYPIQVLFCLYGGGRNGKTCFLKVLSKFLGKKNLCSTDLDLLVGNNKSRFEVFKLYKKLCCLMGETNFGILQSSAVLKKLTGGDLIGFEIKGKQPFDDYNYAKILIASNSLPSSEDTSEGFYRRWVIIDFPNQFKEGKDITLIIPDKEYNALGRKVCEILPKLLEKGEFTNQGSIEDRKQKYIMASNPLPYFIEKCCEQGSLYYVRYSEFYMAYVKFLTKKKRRIVSKKEFSKILTAEGFENRRTSKDGVVDYYVECIQLQMDLLDLPDFKELPLSSYIQKSSMKFKEIGEIGEKITQNDINNIIEEEVLIEKIEDLKKK